MSAWSFPVRLAPSGAAPLFLQIARAIAEDISRGRLAPGARLPGTRTLAATLGVHRTTVVAAYQELASQGWTDARQGAATRVVTTLPETRPSRWGKGPSARRGLPSRPAFAVPPATMAPAPTEMRTGTLALWGGVPDLRLVPRDLLGRAWRRVVRARPPLLGYASDGRGEPQLRRALAEMVSSARGVPARADDVLVTRGSQMALFLIARVLLRAGDHAAVETPGYAPARRILAREGAEVWPIAVDEEGLDVRALAALAARVPLRLVHVTPHHQYPTTATLSAPRRLALLALARKAGFAVVEDDYDHEFHYDGRPVLPLASADEQGVVVYVGTLAKVLAPGLRLGYVVAPPPLLTRLAEERVLIDRHGELVLERAVAELIEDGEIQRHVRRMRRIYQARRDALCEALERRLGARLVFRRPAGGMALWAHAPAHDVDSWAKRALAAGLTFQTGATFSADGRPTPHLRLGFAVAHERELNRAASILAATYDD